MFLKIKMDNTTLVINLGSDLSQATNLVEMFEQNAKVVYNAYSELKLVQPVSTIELGNTITFEESRYGGEESAITLSAENDAVGCVNANTNAFIDLQKINNKHTAQLNKLKKDITGLQLQLSVANQRIEELETSENGED